jgi:hypothetical protein
VKVRTKSSERELVRDRDHDLEGAKLVFVQPGELQIAFRAKGVLEE